MGYFYILHFCKKVFSVVGLHNTIFESLPIFDILTDF